MKCKVCGHYMLGEKYKGMDIHEARHKAYEEWWAENIGSTLKDYIRWFEEDGLYPYGMEQWEEFEEDWIVSAITFNGAWYDFDFEEPEEPEETPDWLLKEWEAERKEDIHTAMWWERL